MRLWHKLLIPVLPRQQLLEQYRECCAIAKSIHDKGTPNHILVNKIMKYPVDDFASYCSLIRWELYNRGYKLNNESWIRLVSNLPKGQNWHLNIRDIFIGWHNERYLNQCLHNLQEKRDCNGIADYDWKRIVDRFPDYVYE